MLSPICLSALFLLVTIVALLRGPSIGMQTHHTALIINANSEKNIWAVFLSPFVFATIRCVNICFCVSKSALSRLALVLLLPCVPTRWRCALSLLQRIQQLDNIGLYFFVSNFLTTFVACTYERCCTLFLEKSRCVIHAVCVSLVMSGNSMSSDQASKLLSSVSIPPLENPFCRTDWIVLIWGNFKIFLADHCQLPSQRNTQKPKCINFVKTVSNCQCLL